MSPEPNRESLDALAVHHGTDKGSQRHGFTWIYEMFLDPRRMEDVAVLEIGVYQGASLRMWRDYFPNGHIYGVDINPTATEHAGDRISVFIGDQKDPELLEQIVEHSGPLDLIIDDGSHRYPDQRATLEFLWPHLKPKGLYMVEDIHTSYLERWGMRYRQPESTVEFLKEIVDDIHAYQHEQAPVLGNVRSVQFYRETALLLKT